MPKPLNEKRQLLINRTMLALNVPEDVAVRLLRLGRQQSLRVNTLKSSPDQAQTELAALRWHGKPFAWSLEGLTCEAQLEAIRDSAAVAEGRVFIQNAASWLPVLALEPQPGEEILDVCAAPGGKTSHIAAITQNQAHITANDNSRARLAKLRANLERLGVKNAGLTMFDATKISRKLEGRQYDKILVDAPCSGEGMMQLDNDRDFATWSVAHIKRLQQLQKRILTQAWQLLKPGGTLVYSTCTMAPEENEAVINYLLRSRGDARILPFDIDLPNQAAAVRSWNSKQYSPEVSNCLRLQPSRYIEAFFVCKLQKLAPANQ